MTISQSTFWRLTPLVVFCLTSCQPAPDSGGLGPPPPPPPPGAPVASLAITPQIASFTSIDETLDFTAIARDSAQNVLTGVSLTWTSSDEAVISIASTGQARAVGDGTATIRVASGGVSATASVTVTSGTGRTILFQEQFEDAKLQLAKYRLVSYPPSDVERSRKDQIITITTQGVEAADRLSRRRWRTLRLWCGRLITLLITSLIAALLAAWLVANHADWFRSWG